MNKSASTATSSESTCVGCKFLYAKDSGYSNWTVENTDINCALGKNPNLPAEEPYDWIMPPHGTDNWSKTCKSRCERYAPGDMVRLDVDGETGPADQTNDQEVIDAICKDAGVEPKGY